MNLIIRADATSAIGIGHVMRCIALAERWQGKVYFVSHCDVSVVAELIQSRGFQYLYASDSADGWRTVAHVVRTAGARVIVFDGYEFTPSDFARAAATDLTVVTIDDNAHQPSYAVDVLVNQNLHAPRLRYAVRNDTLCLFGTDYALVRRELRHDRSVPPRPTPSTLLITVGGSDVSNLTPKLVDAVRQLTDISATVVVGVANPRIPQLRKIVEDIPSIRLESDVLDMSKLMAAADVVLTAAGSTCWECCCLGIPMMTVVVANNQRSNAEALAAANACVNLGWHEGLTAEIIAQELRNLLADVELRCRIAANAKRLVDGRGAQKVANAIAARASLRKGSVV